MGEVVIDADGSASLDVDIGTRDYTLLEQCGSVEDAVLRPPSSRLTIRQGRLVAWRKVSAGVAE